MRHTRLSVLFVILFCSALLLGSRSSIPKIPVIGELAGLQIRTTVDSELAKYYLESYLPNKERDRSLIR
jgi:hypothetical protein